MPMKATTCSLAAALALAAVPPALARSFTCFEVQPGDTASLLALRLTGDVANRREPWFQIFEPESSRYVPKAEYRRILPGWQACIAEERVLKEWVPPPPALEPLPPAPAPSSAGFLRRLRTGGLTVISSGLLLSLAALLAWHTAAAYSSGRRTQATLMTLFGERFVREFERPLIRPGSAEPADRSRLRVKPGRGRLDILLAPHDGRTSPNLSDHRQNVEYDVGRVLDLLNDERFVSERLSRQGTWVIVHCRFRADLTLGGGP